MRAIDDLLSRSIAHESVPDRVAPALTIAAWVGLGLLAIEGLLIWVGQGTTTGFAAWPVVRWAFTGLSRPGLVLGCIAVIVASGLILAAMTNGFRQANRNAQIAQLGLLGVGTLAAVPLLWVATVAVAVAAFFVAIVAVIVAFLIGLLAA